LKKTILPAINQSQTFGFLITGLYRGTKNHSLGSAEAPVGLQRPATTTKKLFFKFPMTPKSQGDAANWGHTPLLKNSPPAKKTFSALPQGKSPPKITPAASFWERY